MPDLGPYDGAWEQIDHVQAIGNDFERGRHRSRPQWLHQMRSDLGRLGAIAEILQVGPFLALGRALGVAVGAVVYCTENAGSIL
jgi:hypothetical protein